MALNLNSFASKLKTSESALQNALNQLPVHVGGLLGCGAIGCTFQGTEGSVVKVTKDTSEIALWNQIVDMDEKGIDLTDGVPEVYAIGAVPGIDAYFVHREEVEPLVLGSEKRLSTRTIKWLMRDEWRRFEGLAIPDDDWSIEHLLRRLRKTVPAAAIKRAKILDEDLHKLYVLTDVEQFAEKEPSIMEDVWLEAYIETAMSVRGPLEGIGEAIASMVAETGTRWITDVHMGNVGWRLGKKPQLLVYDWLTVDLIPNGLGVA